MPQDKRKQLGNAYLARFNLRVLEGERTGDADVPEWVAKSCPKR